MGQRLAPPFFDKQHRFHKVWHGPVLLFGGLLHKTEDLWLNAQDERITLDFRLHNPPNGLNEVLPPSVASIINH